MPINPPNWALSHSSTQMRFVLGGGVIEIGHEVQDVDKEHKQARWFQPGNMLHLIHEVRGEGEREERSLRRSETERRIGLPGSIDALRKCRETIEQGTDGRSTSSSLEDQVDVPLRVQEDVASHDDDVPDGNRGHLQFVLGDRSGFRFNAMVGWERCLVAPSCRRWRFPLFLVVLIKIKVKLLRNPMAWRGGAQLSAHAAETRVYPSHWLVGLEPNNYQNTVLYTRLMTVYDSRLHQNKTNWRKDGRPSQTDITFVVMNALPSEKLIHNVHVNYDCQELVERHSDRSRVHKCMDTFQMNPKSICADVAFHHPHDLRIQQDHITPWPNRAEMGMRLFQHFLGTLG